MTIKVSLGPSASSSLIGTIGSSTVEVNQKTKVVAFVRAPTQLGGGAGPQQQQQDSQQQQTVSCATGEVVLTLVRAPFAFSRVHDNESDDDFLLQKQLETQKQLQSTILSGPSSLVTQHQEASSLLQMIRKALDKSILKEALPLARFDLVVQILSSVNDDDDFRGITTAACAALMDANIPLKDVFGAACSSSSSSSSSSSIRMIVAGHSQSILGMQISNHSNNNITNNDNNTNNVDNICQGIEECTSRCVKETLESLRLAAAEKISRNKTNTTTSKK